ncbi:MAG: 23S rRNA (guanosine(2251)-2'-O)-methyltransferase RlmB [Gammaproteobacteria bacterium]
MSSNTPFIFGLHAVEALLKNQPDRILRLAVFTDRQDKKIEAILRTARTQNIAVGQASKQELDKMTESANHQGIVAFCKKARAYSEADLNELLGNLNVPPFVLVLDGVTDPHNLGACLRSADAAGVHAVIIPKDRAAGITPVVSKVASGAAETIPLVQVTNLARALEILKEMGIWVYGAAGEATASVYSTKLTGAIAIVMGAEGEGLRRLTRDTCDVLLKIPMQGTVSSLNVSVATGVLLFEVVRQRQ